MELCERSSGLRRFIKNVREDARTKWQLRMVQLFGIPRTEQTDRPKSGDLAEVISQNSGHQGGYYIEIPPEEHGFTVRELARTTAPSNGKPKLEGEFVLI